MKPYSLPESPPFSSPELSPEICILEAKLVALFFFVFDLRDDAPFVFFDFLD